MNRRRKLWALVLLGAWLASCAPTVRLSGTIKKESVQWKSAARNTFVAGRRANEDLAFTFQPSLATQELILKMKAPESVTMKQVQRTVTNDTYIQGHKGSAVEEEFPIQRLDKLDLLLVVDNSSSMGPYQEKLSAGLAPLLTHISNTDWRIMVTSISALRRRNPADPNVIDRFYGCPRINPADPQDRAVISRDDYVRDPASVNRQFAWKVMVGETGDPIERGVLAATSGLLGECGEASRSWIRADAHKAVLMLTDEENCGSDPDQNCDTSPDSNPQYFLDKAPPGTQFFALLHDTTRYGECLDVGYIRKPDDYRWLIAKTGGREGNMCIGNYAETLTEISRDMHPVTRNEFDLRHVPETGSIRVMVDGRPWSTDIIIDGKKIFFGSTLPNGSKLVKIAYNHDPEPIITNFGFSASADLSTLQVKVNGRMMAPSQYQLEGDGIVFNQTPPDLAIVELIYRVEQSLPQAFPVPDDAVLESLTATVDATPRSDFIIVGSNEKEIYFTQAPLDGASIVLTFETTDARTLSYPSLAYDRNKIEELTAFDSTTLAPIPLTWDNQQLLFRREDIQNERPVSIVYQLVPETKELVLELNQKARVSSLVITSSEAGKLCAAGASRQASTLTFPCPPEELGELFVSYEYITQIDRKFRMRGEFSQDAVWKVKIDGAETSDYTRSANVIEFPNANFHEDTLIEIEVFELVRRAE
jgi:hypothetical protein